MLIGHLHFYCSNNWPGLALREPAEKNLSKWYKAEIQFKMFSLAWEGERCKVSMDYTSVPLFFLWSTGPQLVELLVDIS